MKKNKVIFLLILFIFFFVGCENKEVKDDIKEGDSNVTDNNGGSSGEIVSDVLRPDENVQFVE